MSVRKLPPDSVEVQFAVRMQVHMCTHSLHVADQTTRTLSESDPHSHYIAT